MRIFPPLLLASLLAVSLDAATRPAANRTAWQVGTPIVTYWCGPTLTDKAAQQMAEGGFNLVWCREQDLDIAERHGLRAQLHDGLLSPASLTDPAKRAQLDALIERVRKHPALYDYYITDEPSAAQFPELGRLVAHLRERDPVHLAYINLFPTYANNEQLGTKGDVVTAYQAHLDQYVATVKPALISYDHYQFALNKDSEQYFLNLAMIRRTAQQAGLPFLNIVQACTWAPKSMRVPNSDEVRYLVYTTAAYGAQGLSYYIYTCDNHIGGFALADGTPTPLYHAVSGYNREFVALTRELQPLRSTAVYHTKLREQGCDPLPERSPFRVQPAPDTDSPRGFALGCFGRKERPTHVLVVNLDYQREVTGTVTGPARLSVFDASTGKWTPAKTRQATITLPPGGGRLLRTGS